MRELLARLDQDAGWCGVFWQRDPDGMRACLDGVEIPPWDVVQALLHDLAADRSLPEAEREAAPARALHRASLDAYDARPGGRELLGDRLDMMLTEQRIALEREADLTRRLTQATAADEVERINLDLAWVRDDHERATARCAELQERMDRLTEAERPSWVDMGPARSPAEPRVPRQSARRPRGARFAGLANDPTPTPTPEHGDAPAPTETEAPRGARFAPGAKSSSKAKAKAKTKTKDQTKDQTEATGATKVTEDEAARATAAAVQDLVRLRGEGRSGEAHGVLVEATAWPAARLPRFAVELHQAGLSADWATLLWEAASLPPDRLVALADALAGAGRADDCRKLLRQGVARPAPEIAEAVLALLDAGREREARALLDSYLRVRTAEDAARCAHTDPYRLIPLLLETAKDVSEEHHWDLVHALRVAGFSA